MLTLLAVAIPLWAKGDMALVRSKQGFVYLPRSGEPWGGLNEGSIYRGSGIEGHWFHATNAGQSFVDPILDKGTDVSAP